MLVHSQGTFTRVVHFRINTTAPAVGLSRAPQKRQKNTLRIIWTHIRITQYMLVSWLHQPEKTKKMSRVVLVRARTGAAVKILPVLN